jgi:23S rRNA (cytidine1920-2'-O)/16S rRNA (cytidine1409-2'-O)-methyltransferase
MTLAVPPVARLLRDGGAVVSLVKPQFEAGKGQVGRGGVVRDPAVHRSVLSDLARWGELEGYGFRALAVSPIRGPAGNVEFLALIAPGEPNAPDIQAQIDSVLERVSEI